MLTVSDHPDNTCPICKGKGKSFEADGVPRTNWIYQPWTDEAGGGDGKPAAFLTCDGCDGSGLRSDYTARVLAGEFPPQNPSWRQYAGEWKWTTNSPLGES